MVKCSMCPMIFDKSDPDYNNRISRHDPWHMNARKEKRNTTQGTPIYNEVGNTI